MYSCYVAHAHPLYKYTQIIWHRQGHHQHVGPQERAAKITCGRGDPNTFNIGIGMNRYLW